MADENKELSTIVKEKETFQVKLRINASQLAESKKELTDTKAKYAHLLTCLNKSVNQTENDLIGQLEMASEEADYVKNHHTFLNLAFAKNQRLERPARAETQKTLANTGDVDLGDTTDEAGVGRTKFADAAAAQAYDIGLSEGLAQARKEMSGTPELIGKLRRDLVEMTKKKDNEIRKLNAKLDSATAEANHRFGTR